MSEERTIALTMRDGKLDKSQYGDYFCGVKTKNLWLAVVSRDNYNVVVRLPDDFDRLPNIFVEDRKKRTGFKKKKPIIRAAEGKPIAPKKSWLKKFNNTGTQTRRFDSSKPNTSATPSTPQPPSV